MNGTKEYKTEKGLFILGDCMQGMAATPDKYYDIAIVDPPYGINCDTSVGGNSTKGIIRGFKNKTYIKKDWDSNIPDKKYFNELFRVSKCQIVWGGNYFTDKLPVSKSWAVWYKNISQHSLCHSDVELAWCTPKYRTQLFAYDYIGIGYINNKKTHGEKTHPTQKPIALYKWIVKNYVKPSWKILDTHVGSASSLIAYEEAGLEYVGYELDADYYKAAVQRIKDYRMQGKLFKAGIV